MTVEPMRPTDAADVIALSQQWGQPPPNIAPGGHGCVVRHLGEVQAFAILRETGLGFCVDELWCKKDKTGRVALWHVGNWLEATVSRIARERGVKSLPLGGIVRIDNPDHDTALARRGYEVVAVVRAKDIPAERVGENG